MTHTIQNANDPRLLVSLMITDDGTDETKLDLTVSGSLGLRDARDLLRLAMLNLDQKIWCIDQTADVEETGDET